jgi:hypothetical protein
MLSAIETPANQGAPFVNRAALFAEVNARSLRGRFEKKDGFSRFAGYSARPVRVHIITLIGMKK